MEADLATEVDHLTLGPSPSRERGENTLFPSPDRERGQGVR
jgi:hypothetical protein